MLFRFCRSLFVVIIFCHQSFAATNITFLKYTLSNGLKVILHKDSTVPVVAVTALYHVGSKNENPARTGFAHFFEHLLFEGSKNIQRGEFDQYVAMAGGALNANTTQDRTFYYELLPSYQVNLGLWLESERMRHANILPIGVETQREVVKEEKRQRYDNRPYGSLIIEVLKRAYKGTPYEWATIGNLQHINDATLDEFIDFYHTYYVPENCVLSIAGNINIDSVKNTIEKYFSVIPKAKKPIQRTNKITALLSNEIRDTIIDNIQLPALVQTYRAPAQGTPDSYAFEVIASILNGGQSARFNTTLIDQKKLAVNVGAIPWFNEDGGLFINYIMANMGVQPHQIESVVDSIITQLTTTKIDNTELTKVKNQLEYDFINNKTTMAGIAEGLANYEVYFGDANLINTEIERYRQVSAEDVLKVAQKYLTKNNRVVLYYLPKMTTITYNK